jgi:hypothetical protein
VVSGPSFAQILAFEGRRLQEAADAWARLADRVHERAKAVVEPQRAAEQAWQGPAAQLANRRLRRLRQTVDAMALPLRRHEHILTDLAQTGARLREHARDLVARAAAAGVRIHLDGTVTPHSIEGEFAAATVASFRRQVAEVVAEAVRVDAEAVRRLADEAPWAHGQAHAFVPRSAIPEAGSDPAGVHRWWHDLDPAQRRYLLSTHPALVGALDGVPAAARDQANQALLASARERFTTRLAELRERQAQQPVTPATHLDAFDLASEIAAVASALAARDLIQRRRDTRSAGGQRCYLLRFDAGGDGRVVLANGNPDRADHVLTYVPGTGSTLASVPGHMVRAERMRHDATAAAPEESTAVVYWLDYDAPDTLPAAASGEYADRAAEDLRRFADGLRATHPGEGPHHTVLGHSYGSTVVGQAAAGGLGADNLVFLGSPGVGVDSAAELRISSDPTRNVWSSTAWSDEIKLTSGREWRAGVGPAGHVLNRVLTSDMPHGLNPSASDFGGRTFAADALSRHSGYWEEGNVARDHIARITTDRSARR